MPLLKIQVNIEFPTERRTELLKTASMAVAEMLGKPERYVMVILETNHEILFAGDALPLAFLELKSIDLPGDRTSEFSARLCDLIHSELDIPPERIYIEFANSARNMWGWNRRTFER